MSLPLEGISPQNFLQKINSYIDQIESATQLPSVIANLTCLWIEETRPIVQAVEKVFQGLEKIDAMPKQIPLPDHFKEKIKADCPFWPGKKVSETHVLKLLTPKMNALDPKHFAYFWPHAQELMGPVEKTGWVLMTRECVPATVGKTHAEALKILAETGYEPPAASVAMQLLFLQSQEDPIFTKSATLVKEAVGSFRCPVTLSLKEGSLSVERFSKPNPLIGMAAIQWL